MRRRNKKRQGVGHGPALVPHPLKLEATQISFVKEFRETTDLRLEKASGAKRHLVGPC